MAKCTFLEDAEFLILEAFTEINPGDCLNCESIQSKVNSLKLRDNELNAAFMDLIKKGWLERASINDWRLTRIGYNNLRSFNS